MANHSDKPRKAGSKKTPAEPAGAPVSRASVSDGGAHAAPGEGQPRPAAKAAARKSAPRKTPASRAATLAAAAVGAELSPAELQAAVSGDAGLATGAPDPADAAPPQRQAPAAGGAAPAADGEAPAAGGEAQTASEPLARVAASLRDHPNGVGLDHAALVPPFGAGVAAIAPPADGRVRVIIDDVVPSVDGGRFAGKCIAGEPTDLVAHAFTDGHDRLRVVLQWRAEQAAGPWQEAEMALDVNDEWHANIVFPTPGRYVFSVTAWVDAFRSWRHDFGRRVDVDDLRIAARVGAELIEATAARAQGADAQALRDWATRLREQAEQAEPQALRTLALDEALTAIAERHPDRRYAATFPERPIYADRAKARFSTWYEMFPRSASAEPGRHGTFADVQARLPYVAEMGFDVLYFPPIHPIGRDKRKGRNNTLTPDENDVGSPWAIGAAEGGHKSIHPALGTAEDFRQLVQRANELGIEVALDIALQCAPDHPYVQEHPQWFKWRPDGTVQYAENPPKKYQDIYPFNFESDDWPALWQELKSIFDHWIGEGVKIFRVDNPHTKSFAFWEWCIAAIQRDHPEVLFLAEAFTRPKVMHRLAKLGFSQSYTYFTWRNTKAELTEYFTELAHGPGYHYFRPNVWPNTPDILNEHLHHAPRSVFMQRLVLAATLSASYGIYGPAYELMESQPVKPGSEEYLDSEKYQLRHWDLERDDSLRWFIARINQIRRIHPALHDNKSLRFMPVDNGQLLAYAKRSPDGRDTVLTVVNLDPHHTQAGFVDVNLDALDLRPDADYVVHDVLGGQRYTWRNGRNFVSLDPSHSPAHVFVVHQHARDERNFDGFGG